MYDPGQNFYLCVYTIICVCLGSGTCLPLKGQAGLVFIFVQRRGVVSVWGRHHPSLSFLRCCWLALRVRP